MNKIEQAICSAIKEQGPMTMAALAIKLDLMQPALYYAVTALIRAEVLIAIVPPHTCDVYLAPFCKPLLDLQDTLHKSALAGVEKPCHSNSSGCSVATPPTQHSTTNEQSVCGLPTTTIPEQDSSLNQDASENNIAQPSSSVPAA